MLCGQPPFCHTGTSHVGASTSSHMHAAFSKQLGKQRTKVAPSLAPHDYALYAGGGEDGSRPSKEGLAFGSATARDSCFDGKPGSGGNPSTTVTCSHAAGVNKRSSRESMGFGSGSSRFDDSQQLRRQATVTIQKHVRGATARTQLQSIGKKMVVGTRLGFGSASAVR